ncbi:hypothetical protein QWY31_14280 [Cytophagales bacterium LB-30]|uniref:Uncharacterized protein n=1 Tax=Shiella aurantiaca TaxID=3058365 RepID=A0ABT8F8U9_9BACT|nr:DUF6687 family protein [Shiella aurantiaca]MDN4166674.1 hypothetical protein [Shiella aurantiaca]
MAQFLPFSEIKNYKNRVVVVDAHHPYAFALSHWKGVQQPLGCEDDTSLGIVLNALKKMLPETNWPYVSNNHFDADGFLGIWAYLHPHEALAHEETLRQMALIGDFREFNPTHPQALEALALVCWLNSVEKKRFYAPFGSPQEARMCVPKYEYFLPRFEFALAKPETCQAEWKEEFEEVLRDYALVNERKLYGEASLMEVQASRPLHYYALFAHSESVDYVMSLYPDNRYELENKYSSWVTTSLRKTMPRLPLKTLAERLNTLEKSGLQWVADGHKDTGPLLRLQHKKLSKEERYHHPYGREIPSSSIPPEQWKAEVIGFLSAAYKDTQGQAGGWSWAETAAFHEQVFGKSQSDD